MMQLAPWMILGTLMLAPPLEAARGGGIVALRAERAETVANGTLEHAVILVEDGRITAVGEDLPVERGIPVIDLPPEWVVMPGLVSPYSRIAMDSKGKSDSSPHLRASAELYPRSDEYTELLELGVTTLGQYPAGSGIPGRAVAVTPRGDTTDEMILADDVYLKILLRATSSSKRMLSQGFEKVDDFLEKEAKNREKWEKEEERKKKKKKSSKKDDDDDEDEDKDKKDDDDKKDEEDDENEPSEYVPLVPDPPVAVFMALRDRELRALVSISKAGEYLHWLDALGEEEIDWDLRVPLTRESDLFLIADRLGEAGTRIVMEPSISLHPGTMRQRNLAAELARAGAKLCLIPRLDSVSGHEQWLRHTAEVVAAGLDRQAALRGLTLEPAHLLGLGEEIGSIEEGRRANLVIFNGDPLEIGTEVQAVMLDGEFVSGEVQQ